MTKLKTSNKQTIDGYTVEMLDQGDGMNCYISKKSPRPRLREYNASLACLMDTGELDSSDGYAHKVHQQTIDAIEQFALANGY